VEPGISPSRRVIANFPDDLSAQQRQGAICRNWASWREAEANIIKLPNISASLPQLKAVITELNGQGYRIPDYPEVPRMKAQKAQARLPRCWAGGHPVLREGNSDRRVANAVKHYAKTHPHSMARGSRLTHPCREHERPVISMAPAGGMIGQRNPAIELTVCSRQGHRAQEGSRCRPRTHRRKLHADGQAA